MAADIPLVWRPIQRKAAISVNVHPPRKNTTVVLDKLPFSGRLRVEVGAVGAADNISKPN